MKKFLAWLKNVFSRETSQKVIAAAEHTAMFLKEHEEALTHAQRLVEEVEVQYADRPNAGAQKWSLVTNMLTSAWRTLKPHVIALIVGIAVDMLKRGISERESQP